MLWRPVSSNRVLRALRSIGTGRKESDILNKWVVKKVNKGVWGMPRLLEAKKDVVSCEKLRGFANRN